MILPLHNLFCSSVGAKRNGFAKPHKWEVVAHLVGMIPPVEQVIQTKLSIVIPTPAFHTA